MKKYLMIAAAAATVISGMAVTEAYASGKEKKCAACHNFDASHKVGPGLAGVVGRAAGATDFAKYGKDVKAGGWNWDEANLRAWMCDSKGAIKDLSGNAKAKTKMANQKVCKAADQDEVIAFLKGL